MKLQATVTEQKHAVTQGTILTANIMGMHLNCMYVYIDFLQLVLTDYRTE